MIRTIFFCTVLSLGFSSVFAGDDPPAPSCTPTPAPVAVVVKPKPKPKPAAAPKCCTNAVDNVARSDNKRQDTEIGALEKQINGDGDTKGLVSLIGDVDTNSKERDAALQSQINTKASNEDLAVALAQDNLWWWLRLIGVGTVLALIVGFIGWWLPRPPHVVMQNNQEAPPDNPPANLPAAAVQNNQAPLGLANQGNNLPANPPVNPLAVATPATPALVGQNRFENNPNLLPPPTITGVSNAIRPEMIPVSGGWPMTVTGTSFQTGCKVYFGDNEALDVTFVNIQRLVVVAPPADQPGLCSVRVVNPDSQSVVANEAVEYF
jgi:hypothetical protein